MKSSASSSPWPWLINVFDTKYHTLFREHSLSLGEAGAEYLICYYVSMDYSIDTAAITLMTDVTHPSA